MSLFYNINKESEEQILQTIDETIEQTDNCSIQTEAKKILAREISFSEQKRLAKLAVKRHPYVTETKGKEIIIKKNHIYDKSGKSGDGSTGVIIIILIMAAILSYFLLHVFLPGLK